MAPRVRSLVRLASLAVVCCVLLIGATEVFFRFFPSSLPEAVQLRLHWRHLVDAGMSTVPDPEVGFMFEPNQNRTVRRGNFGFTYTTDDSGFRNPAPWPARPDIVVLGDSQAFSYGVDDDSAWTNLVAEGPPRRDLINLGLIAAAPRQQLSIFERFGAPLRPKVTLYALFPGSALDAASKFDSWLEAGRPGNYDDWRFGDDDMPVPVRMIKSTIRHSYVLMALRNVAEMLGSSWSGTTLAFSDNGRIQLAPSVFAPTAARATLNGAVVEGVIDTLREIRDLAQEVDSRFVVVLFPTKEEVYLPLLERQTPQPLAPFAAKLDEHGIPYLDLTPPFQARARQGERLFFEVDIHPNDDGYRLVADSVLEYLKSHAQEFGLEDRH